MAAAGPTPTARQISVPVSGGGSSVAAAVPLVLEPGSRLEISQTLPVEATQVHEGQQSAVSSQQSTVSSQQSAGVSKEVASSKE